jgi:predicted MFS family arabinose efflux permease
MIRMPERGEPESAKAPPIENLREGFRYAWEHRPVRDLLLLMGATTIFGMPLIVLMPFFADDVFHRGSQGLGMLSAAFGCGAVIGVLALAGRDRTAGLDRIVAWSAAMLGAGFVLFAASTWFYLSVAMMVFIGFSVFRQLASANTLVQTTVPDDFRGRTMALYSMTVVGLGPVGSLLAGAVAHAVGVRATVAASGVLCVIAAAVYRMYGAGHE